MIGVKNRTTGKEQFYFSFKKALAYADIIQQYEVRKNASLIDWVKNFFRIKR